VSWKTYKSILADYEDRIGPRLTYDEGRLEIRMVSPEHAMPINAVER
jgi:hypothetical protein